MSPEAIRDLNSIYSFLRSHIDYSGIADKILDEIGEGIRSLDRFPHRFQKVGRMFRSGEEVRRMPIGKYAVFYIVEENSVIVIDVFYSGSEAIKDKFKLSDK